MSYQKCPVCLGRGFVEYGFYDSVPPGFIRTNSESSTVPQPPKCRSCNGVGVLHTIQNVPVLENEKPIDLSRDFPNGLPF